MLMGVEMCRLTADELPEALELSLQLATCVPAYSSRRQGRTSPRRHSASPRLELDVQPKSQVRGPARELRGLCRSRAIDHQARTRDDAMLVCLDDPAVDTSARAEVVRVHDQRPQRTRLTHRMGRGRTSKLSTSTLF